MIDDAPKDQEPAPRQSWLKAIERAITRAWFAVLTFLAVVVGAAWFHSERVGFERRWSDLDGPKCGRIVSARGFLFRQTCDLSDQFLKPGDPMLANPRVMPADFAVGSPGGESSKIECGSFEIPFLDPAPGVMFGFNWKTQMNFSGSPPTRWTAGWSESVMAYWFVEAVIVLLLVISAVASLIGWWSRARKRA